MKSLFPFHKPMAIPAFLLLCASAVLAQGNPVNVVGAIHGYDVATVEFPNLLAAAGGRGTMSHFGSFTFTLQAKVDLPTGKGIGVFVLAFSNGDTIYGTVSGQGDAPPPPPPAPTHIMESLTIQGGTGRFRGATGKLTFQREVILVYDDPTMPPVYDSHAGMVTGTINIPAK